MKNFLELRDTLIDLSVSMLLRPITDNGVPLLSISMNSETVYRASLSTKVFFQKRLPLMEPVCISISMSNKQYSAERETAIVLESLQIGDIELVPRYTGHLEYHTDQGIKTPTNYLGFNGDLTFSTKEPFYHWAHRITGQGWLLVP